MNEVRTYPKHARSLSARALRQRVLLLAAVLVLAALASVIVVPRMFRHSGGYQPKATATKLPLNAAAVARNKAASWIRDWVSASAVVACDPLMCRVLEAHGVATARVRPIGAQADSRPSADVVVATPVIRDQFGARLAQMYAPGVLARFGAGPVRVDVRVVVNGGAAGRYLRQLHADVLARRTAGRALLDNPDVVVSGPAARAMAAGEVDSRLLANLATLAARNSPLAIVGLGGSGPGATPGMPLLSMSVTPLVRRPGISLTVGQRQSAWMATSRVARVAKALGKAAERVMDFLEVQPTPLMPASCSELRVAGGRIVIKINFSAPEQFGVFGAPVEEGRGMDKRTARL